MSTSGWTLPILLVPLPHVLSMSTVSTALTPDPLTPDSLVTVGTLCGTPLTALTEPGALFVAQGSLAGRAVRKEGRRGQVHLAN